MTVFRALPKDLLDIVAEKKVIIYDESRFEYLVNHLQESLPDTVSIGINAMTPPRGYMSLHYRARSNRWEMATFRHPFDRHPLTAAAAAAREAALAAQDLRPLIHHVHRGSPTGLHAWESVLRDSGIAFESPPSDKLINQLASNVGRHNSVTDVVLKLARVLKPAFFFSGHDCYVSASVKNAFIVSQTPSWTVYKNSFNPVYRGPGLGYVNMDGVVFSRRHTAKKENAAKAIWNTHAHKAREKLDMIVKDYGQLSYMDVSKDDIDYRGATGHSSLGPADSLGAFLSPPEDPPLGNDQPIFVLAMHSFADEATVQGLDMFTDMFDFFISVAAAIARAAPEARIAVRFHPNTLDKDLNPIEARDCALQRALYHKLRAKHGSVLVSNVRFRLANFDPGLAVIPVTRWGTIGLECIHLGRPLLCSPLALYADCIPKDFVISTRHCIDGHVKSILDMAFRGERPAYDLDRAYRLAASLFFDENGSPRLPHFGLSDEGIKYLWSQNAVLDRRASVRPEMKERRRTLGDEGYRKEVAKAFAGFLSRSCETQEDRILVQSELNWSPSPCA